MALKMLAAYYSKGCDSRAMFSGLKLGDFRDCLSNRETGLPGHSWSREQKSELFEMGLNRYDTLYIDMQGILGQVMDDEKAQQEIADFYELLPRIPAARLKIMRHPMLSAMQSLIIEDLRKNDEFSRYIPANENSLGNTLLTLYTHTGKQFVILIDEWDCIFRNYEDDRILQDKYIDLLRDWFKNTALLPVYALVYMTGILPVKRYGTQSALNNFKEYTMLDMSPLESFTGFTEEETFALYEAYDMDFQKAQEWYDGYQLENFGHIYNPNSVVQSITRGKFGSYWTSTGTYDSVKQPINMDFDGLKEKIITMLGGGKCRVDSAGFHNTMNHFENADDVLTLLIHLGYLGFDAANNEVYIPNKEIRDEFVRAIQGDKWSKTYSAITRSDRLLAATLACDETCVAACIEKIHEDNTSILTYNDENALSCVIQLAYYKAQDDYWIVREFPAGKGFADIAFIPRRGVNTPAMIVELKWKKDVQTAINQIYDRNYSNRFRDYFGEVLLVGISYEKGNVKKTHTCKIERVNKK